jgi:hypothetical protein
MTRFSSRGGHINTTSALPTGITAVAAMLGTCVVSNTLADVLSVCQDGSCQYSDVQSAINASSAGDVIEIAAGMYHVSATINPHGKAITIRGAVDSGGRPITILDGQHQRRVIQCSSGESASTVLESLVIQRGAAEYGAGLFIYQFSAPTVTNCIVSNNLARWGAGLMLHTGADAQLRRCVVTDNASEFGAGIHVESSEPTMTECRLEGNYASVSGGGLYLYQSGPTMIACTIASNSATWGGGAYFEGAAPIMVLCTISNNVADTSGGGLYSWESSGEFWHLDVVDNHSSWGAGAFIDRSGGTWTESMFSTNEATTNGGALYILQSNGSLDRCVMSSNHAYAGGGVCAEKSTVMMSGCALTDNHVTASGGGVFTFDSTCHINQCAMTGNTAQNSGGGVAVWFGSGSVDFSGCEIQDNQAWFGGGVSCLVPTMIQDSFVCGNTAINGPQIYGRDYAVLEATCVRDDCSQCDLTCVADITSDKLVSGADLGLLLAAWGSDGTQQPGSDCTGDGLVDGADLAVVLSAWGPCPD